jgi:hypothetical protein
MGPCSMGLSSTDLPLRFGRRKRRGCPRIKSVGRRPMGHAHGRPVERKRLQDRTVFLPSGVITGLVPVIHAFFGPDPGAWMAGTSRAHYGDSVSIFEETL